MNFRDIILCKVEMCNIFNENDFKINKNVFDHCNLSSSHFREHTCDPVNIKNAAIQQHYPAE